MKQQDNSFESLSEHLTNLTEHGIQGMNEQQVLEHRKAILQLAKQVRSALANTSTKEHSYNDEDVMLYIQDVLNRGYALEATKLSHNTMFEDAQHLTWWKHIIKACVQQSLFSAKKFKVAPLAVQRADIEQSTTLHELRQNVKAMIGPLELYRETIREPEAIEYALTTEDQLIVEIEQLTLEVNEYKRIVAEMTNLYDEPLIAKREKQEQVDAVDAFKKEHNCTNEEACKVFNMSISTLKRMRKELLESN